LIRAAFTHRHINYENLKNNIPVFDFGILDLNAQSFGLSIDGSYSRHTIDFVGLASQGGFSPAIGFDVRFDISERSAIQTGVNFAPILLRLNPLC